MDHKSTDARTSIALQQVVGMEWKWPLVDQILEVIRGYRSRAALLRHKLVLDRTSSLNQIEKPGKISEKRLALAYLVLTVLLPYCRQAAGSAVAEEPVQILHADTQRRGMVLGIMPQRGILHHLNGLFTYLISKERSNYWSRRADRRTHGLLVGNSMNFARKIAEAAIIDGGYPRKLYSRRDSSAT